MSMCHREFMRRTEWMRDALVKHHPSFIGLPPGEEWLKLEAQTKEMIQQEADKLGLSFA